MLGNAVFDLWADGYDRSVGLSDEKDVYPFAGYKEVLGEIYSIIRGTRSRRVLDVGCGTGVLGAKLCAAGVNVTGLDFSRKMLALARERMPEAQLVEWDFSKGLPAELQKKEYDVAVCTYAAHHLNDIQKGLLFRGMAKCVRPGGLVLIGDISFETVGAREACRIAAGDDWDEDECYMAMEQADGLLIGTMYSYKQISRCAGLLTMII